MKNLAAALALAVALLFGGMAPAAADEQPWDAETPSLYHPPTRSATSAGDVIVQLDAPAGSWSIRRSARRLDAQVDGVSVRMGGDCSTADLCVSVQVGWYDSATMLELSRGYLTAWGALTDWPTERTSVIYLNAAVAKGRTYRRYAAAHEFGHVLGLGHHAQPGLMSGPDRLLSEAEVEVLEAWYAAQ
jgi:hypothetical protein